ncbi:MAG: hypothetical protein ACRDZ3_17365 [Acidimicrobiia bacterium]
MTGSGPTGTEATPGAGRRRTIPLGVAVAAIAAVVLFVALGPLRPGGRGLFGKDEGPLTAGATTTVGAPHDPGDTLTFGHVAVFNNGKRTAVLDRVSFEPPLPDNLRRLGIQVAPDPDRDVHTIGEMEGYPPTEFDIGRLNPLPGAEVPPRNTPEGERGVPLIMGFRFEGGDLASFRWVLVDYHIGSRRYRAKLDKTFIVCSAAAYPDGCPDREDVYPPE